MSFAANAQRQRRTPKPQSKNGGSSRTGSKSYFNPSQEEVVAAVRSLYADRLEPFGRILLRRVRERCAAALRPGCDADDAPMVDPKNLNRICKLCPGLRVEVIEANEVSVLLLDEPALFVDVTSAHDPYPPAVWAAAAGYFSSLHGRDVLLPGGRYACAEALASMGLPWLTGRSLGEVCHIVQLAVSQKKILGYIDGNMVPYNHSEESVKEQCAAWQQPFSNPAKKQEPASFPVATWDQTRACLSAILRTGCSPEFGVITVSNVKRLFRSRFGLDLSETALGYSRLSELLQDRRLHDVCCVQVRGSGQFVVMAVTRMPPTSRRPYAYGSPVSAWEGASATPSGHADRAARTQLPMPPSVFAEPPVCLSTKPVGTTRLAPPQHQSTPPTLATRPVHSQARAAAASAAAISPPPGLGAARLPWEERAPAAPLEPPSASELLSMHLQRLFEFDANARHATLWALSKNISSASSAGSGDESPDGASTEYCSEHPLHADSDISGRSGAETAVGMQSGHRFGQQADLYNLAMRENATGYPTVLTNKPWASLKQAPGLEEAQQAKWMEL